MPISTATWIATGDDKENIFTSISVLGFLTFISPEPKTAEIHSLKVCCRNTNMSRLTTDIQGLHSAKLSSLWETLSCWVVCNTSESAAFMHWTALTVNFSSVLIFSSVSSWDDTCDARCKSWNLWRKRVQLLWNQSMWIPLELQWSMQVTSVSSLFFSCRSWWMLQLLSEKVHFLNHCFHLQQ